MPAEPSSTEVKRRARNAAAAFLQLHLEPLLPVGAEGADPRLHAPVATAITGVVVTDVQAADDEYARTLRKTLW